MRFLRGFFISLGVLSLAAIFVFGISLLLSPSGAPGGGADSGAISPEVVAQAQAMAARIGRRMAWVSSSGFLLTAA